MNRLTPWLLTVVALAGCAKNTARPTAKMSGPTGVAAFRGYGADDPATLRHLVAVSNTRGDDLRVIDAVTDKVLLGPTLVGALSIPTEPRPTLIAAGRLDDRDPLDASGNTLLPLPDLLVVAPRGLVPRASAPGQFAAAVQVVVTWDPDMRVEKTIDLGDVAPDATITALAVIPAVQPDGSRLHGAARVVVGLSDGGLVTLQATRIAGGQAIAVSDPAPAPAPTVRQDLGFTPLDLAPNADGTRLYVATVDPIPGPGGVLGVAELDLTGPVGAFPVRALPARAGTTRVAWVTVAPFTGNDPSASIPDFDQFGPAAPRVYAAIDLSACGRDRAMPCGVAALDPVAGGLAPDPAGELPYQFPIQVDGDVADLAASGPPVVTDPDHRGYMVLAPGSGRRWTQSIAAISASAGRVYVADLSHFALANDISSLAGSSRARVISSSSFPNTSSDVVIGLWSWLIPTAAGATWQSYVDTFAVFGVGVTPGYTPTDSWTVTYQGTLPGLGQRFGVAQVTAAGQPPTQLALQEDVNPPGSATHSWRSVVRVYDPRLAIHPGDIVQVTALDVASGTTTTNPCPLGTFEMTVTAILPPTPDAPGGSLALAPAATQPTNAGQTVPAVTTCLPSGTSKVAVTVRAFDYVLVGAKTGYAGRPQENFDPADDTVPAFQLKYENEDLLSCPIMPDAPEDWPPPDAAIQACEADVATCRATCERLVLARRARRYFYVTNRCADGHEQSCYNTWVQLSATYNGVAKLPMPLTFPFPKGPVVAFKLAVKRPADAKLDTRPDRDAYLAFSTGSGFSPASRVPYTGTTVTGAVLPGRVILHDRTEATQSEADGIHGFAAFTDNLVLEFGSALSGQNATTIR